MRIQSWNVNGIRAVAQKGFHSWLENSNADWVCLQEVKANREQLGGDLVGPPGFSSVWHSAEKPGYSGTAIYFRKEPREVHVGMGLPEFDREGRVLSVETQVGQDQLLIVNAYFPNSQREHTRLGYKLEFCQAIQEFCDRFVRKGFHVVLCGDYNIAHEEIDLKNPKSNMNNAGFLPEERQWMTKFLGAGYVDTFRRFERAGGHYTWWSYRPGVRQKNIGWRLDYHCVNEGFIDRVQSSKIYPDVLGSDHCPVELVVRG